MQLYEAIVVDGAPDPERPGHIKVKIPELYQNVEVPVLIAPLFPGWTAGGWHSVPSAVNPDDPTRAVRVIVAHLGQRTFRWIGTSQGWDFITDSPGTRCGARSGDGRHAVFIENEFGVMLEVESDDDAGGQKNTVVIATDGTITLRNNADAVIEMTRTEVTIIDAGGSFLQLDNAGSLVILAHSGGTSAVQMSGAKTEVIGTRIDLSGGVVIPLNPFVLSLTLLADLSTLCTDIIAIGAAIPTMAPFVATNAVSMAAKIATSLSAGAPYLSTRIYGD